MWLSPVMFHYGLCHMNIQEVPRVLPNSLKGWGMCYHVYVIGAYKRTHVDHRNMPNHCTSIYHEWMCVCVAALKAIVTRYTAQSVMRTCMFPRELIWERVAPSHTGVTQNSGWPLLQLLWSTSEKAQSLMWCAISNVVSLSLSLSLSFILLFSDDCYAIYTNGLERSQLVLLSPALCIFGWGLERSLGACALSHCLERTRWMVLKVIRWTLWILCGVCHLFSGNGLERNLWS